MIKIKDITDEKWNKVKKEYGPVLSIILRTGNIFYRNHSIAHAPNDIFITPIARTRFTSSHGNYHTLIFDAYLSKRKMPLRSKCIMFETGPRYINNYPGELFYVIPKSNSKLCYVNSHDLWTAFSESIVHVETFNQALNELFTQENLVVNSYDDIIVFFDSFYKLKVDNPTEFKKRLQRAVINCIVDEMEDFNILYNTLSTVKPNIQQWLEYDVFELNDKFNFTTPESLCKSFPKSEIEVWTDSECIMIHESLYSSFIQEYKSRILHDKY